jgi:hypothetical protein
MSKKHKNDDYSGGGESSHYYGGGFWGDDYDDDRQIGYKPQRSYNNYSHNSWFSSWKKKDDNRQCIKNGNSYSEFRLKEFIDLFNLGKAAKTLQTLKDNNYEYVVEDIFNLYFEENRDFNISDENQDWYDQLIKFDSYLIRQFSVSNKTYSYILTAFILEHVLSMLENDQGQCKNPNQGVGNGFESALNKAQDKAQANSKSLEDLKEDLGMGSDSSDNLQDIKLFSESGVIMNVSNIKKFFSKLFGRKGMIPTKSDDTVISIEEIEHARDIGDLVELETLATDFPVFDVFTKSGSKIKFDIYVDVSGSMGCDDIKLPGGQKVTRMAMAKVIAIKMMKLGLLEDIFTFDGAVKQTFLKHPKEIKFTNGGTSYDAVIAHRLKLNSKKKYLILSDGDAYHNSFDPNCYTMTIAHSSSLMSICDAILKGTDNYWSKTSQKHISQYMDKNSIMFYDGMTIGTIKDKISMK